MVASVLRALLCASTLGNVLRHVMGGWTELYQSSSYMVHAVLVVSRTFARSKDSHAPL